MLELTIAAATGTEAASCTEQALAGTFMEAAGIACAGRDMDFAFATEREDFN